jgi:signal transduction histidine kinase
LISVRERLSLIGGTVEMRSEPGGGTVARLTAPLASDEPPNTLGAA